MQPRRKQDGGAWPRLHVLPRGSFSPYCPSVTTEDPAAQPSLEAGAVWCYAGSPPVTREKCRQQLSLFSQKLAPFSAGLVARHLEKQLSHSPAEAPQPWEVTADSCSDRRCAEQLCVPAGPRMCCAMLSVAATHLFRPLVDAVPDHSRLEKTILELELCTHLGAWQLRGARLSQPSGDGFL